MGERVSRIKRRTRIAIGLVLAALATAGGLAVVMTVGTGTEAQPAPRSETVTSSPAVEQPDAAATPSVQPTNGTITQVGPTVVTTTTPQGSQTLTNKSTRVTVTTTPGKQSSPKAAVPSSPPAAKACPMTHSENPTLWDACRAGYIAPTIEFVGLVSCEAVDRDKGNWRVVRKYKMVGGNYRSADWAGLSDNSRGTATLLIRGMPASALTNAIPISLDASIYVHSMNGLPGDIDTVERSWDEDIVLAGVCS
jgi:hypothetical protein